MRITLGIALLSAVGSIGNSVSAEEIGGLPRISEKVRRLTYLDLEGESRLPLACGDGIKASVVIFMTVDCPIANAFQPTIRRLGEKYSDGKVSLTLVHVDPDVDKAKAKKHASEFEIMLPVILDPEHTLVRATGATITPEAVVVLPDGKVIYRGRINDLYSDLGQRRREPRTDDLAEAIDAALADKLPEVAVTPSVGCIIADFRRDPAIR